MNGLSSGVTCRWIFINNSVCRLPNFPRLFRLADQVRVAHVEEALDRGENGLVVVSNGDRDVVDSWQVGSSDVQVEWKIRDGVDEGFGGCWGV